MARGCGPLASRLFARIARSAEVASIQTVTLDGRAVHNPARGRFPAIGGRAARAGAATGRRPRQLSSARDDAGPDGPQADPLSAGARVAASRAGPPRGVRPATINRIEQARRSPSLATFDKLYRALDQGQGGSGPRQAGRGQTQSPQVNLMHKSGDWRARNGWIDARCVRKRAVSPYFPHS
jgi:hypothetical protein